MRQVTAYKARAALHYHTREKKRRLCGGQGQSVIIAMQIVLTLRKLVLRKTRRTLTHCTYVMSHSLKAAVYFYIELQCSCFGSVTTSNTVHSN